MRLKAALQEHKHEEAQPRLLRSSYGMKPSEKDRLARVIRSTKKLPTLKKTTESYYGVNSLLNSRPLELSPGMQEYVKSKRFDVVLERKKHSQLSSYFIVSDT
jgi:hypothetical protein